ncbi:MULTISPECIES: adenylate/guanylate cyclase domain-containing protein [unclassified Brevibacterium]|uniref:adenylate/guanylate cyclase domain-containing protein n=1 Tax=unclassified Brevibacterium TaxID=2614124 RepID=UPI00201803D1|nr:MULTISPECIES: adenylate/guanylate cyclase domain-containing protein [unclassified Brevibacterium]MCM1014064.1 adenylate/guanylate cyclase domain-containing protein [Brevibacterium sp. XM4083]
MQQWDDAAMTGDGSARRDRTGGIVERDPQSRPVVRASSGAHLRGDGDASHDAVSEDRAQTTPEAATPAASAPPKPVGAPEPVAQAAPSAPARSTPARVEPAQTGDDDDSASHATAEDDDHGQAPQATGDAELPATSVMPVIQSAESGSEEAGEDDDASEPNTTAQQTGKPMSSDFFGGLHEDPRTSALSIVDEDTDDDPIYETRSAAERLEEILLDGKRVLDRREAAKLGGISTVSARKMWRALGMSQTDEHDKAYTVSDAHALRMWAKPVADGLIDQETALSLARAIGQTTDRLVVWQMETLVEYLTEEKGMSEPEARREALEVIEDLIDPMQKMLVYSWRRNLAEVMGRLNVNVSDGLAMDNRQGWYDSSMPLARAVGFIDLVSYTRLSQKLEPRQLANMVQEFQGICYNIVATGGGRIIKTVGDEVFFAAETPMAGAEIAMTLMERVSAAADLPQARVGFVWGRVLSRLGDIFGSSVNLAARLTAVAEPGTIFTDEETARVLSTSDAYVFEPRGSLTLQGLGETGICQMLRGTAARMKLDLDDES